MKSSTGPHAGRPRRPLALHCELLEDRRLLACDPAAGQLDCLLPGGELNDGQVSLAYDVQDGSLSLFSDGNVMVELRMTSESQQFRYPNGTRGFEIAESSELLFVGQFFEDLIDFTFIQKGLSDIAVIEDLRASASVFDPGRDGVFGTNDDFVRSLDFVDLIYPIEPDEIIADSPDDAVVLTPSNPLSSGRSLETKNDEDWYTWIAPERGQLSIEAFFEHETGDAELDLYDAELELVARSSTLDRNESVKHEVLAGEQYFIRVYGFQGATQSRYDLLAYLNPEALPVYVLHGNAGAPTQIDVLHPNSLTPLRAPFVLNGYGQPKEIELGPNGLIYVAFDGQGATIDSIVEMTPQGVVTHRLTLPHGGVGPHDDPSGFEVLEDGTFLVPQPNLNRVIQLTRQGRVINVFSMFGTDATVVVGPQATASDIQLPVVAVPNGQVSISPNQFGEYWVAETNRNRIRKFNSDGTEDLEFRIDAPQVVDVQESANRDIYTLEGNRLRIRSITENQDTSFFANFDDIITVPFSISGGGPGRPKILSDGDDSFLRIAHLANDSQYSVAFDEQSDQSGPSPNGLVMSFDFRMTDDNTNNEAGGCCGSAADGFGVGIFDVQKYGTAGPVHPPAISGDVWERPAFPDAFTVGFDVFPNIDRVTLNWQSRQIAEIVLDERFDLNDNQFHQAVVQITPNGDSSHASVWLDDVLIASDVAISKMSLDELFRYRVITGGRTGSAFSNIDLDNVSVRSVGFFEDFSGSTNEFAFVNSNGDRASVENERRNSFARLTRLEPYNNNAIAFSESAVQTGPSQDGLLLSFDFRMTTDEANREAGGQGLAAEGIGLGLFDVRKYGAEHPVNPGETEGDLGWERPWFDGALTVGLRIADEVDEVSISLGGEQIISEKLNARFPINDGAYHTARMKVTPENENARISLWIDDRQVIKARQLEGFLLSDLPAYRIIAGARTRKDYTQADIDNITLASIGLKKRIETTVVREANVGPAIALAVTDGEKPVLAPGRPTDRDGDGLYDKWETDGIDANGDGVIDLVLPDADPDHKDLYIEIDALDGRVPSDEALDKLREAFADVPNSLLFNPDGEPGIRLHMMVDEIVAPTPDLAQLPADVDEFWRNFYTNIRPRFFGSPAERTSANAENILAAKELAYRYAFWGDRRGTQGRSGIAEKPGQNMVITMGEWRTPGGTPTQQAAIFMHEIGHTLGLGHGAGDDIGFKPNHLSVMNYSHTSGSTIVNGEPFLDFSRYAPNSPDPAYRNIYLDEARLDELQGFGFPPDVSFVFALGDNEIEVVDNQVDWDRNGTVGGIVQRDLNKKRPGELLKSYNEWGSLLYRFRNYHGSGDGGYPDEEPRSDICERYNAENRPSGADQFECNNEATFAWPDNPSDGLPFQDDANINGPADEDWFIIRDLPLYELITILLEPLQPTDPQPEVDVIVYRASDLSIVQGVARSIGSSVEHVFAASSPGDYLAQIVSTNASVPFINYRLSIQTAAPSDTFTWNGSVSSEWSDGQNWDGGIAPIPGQNVVIPADSLRTSINIDSDQLINRMTVHRDVEFTATDDAEFRFVEGRIDIPGSNTVAFADSVDLRDSVEQTGSGTVELHGSAETWSVSGDGKLIGYGQVDIVTVLDSATLTAGSVTAPFDVTTDFTLLGTLLVDVMAYQISKPDLDTINVGNTTTIGGSSRIEFEVSYEPTPHQLSAVGLQTDAVIQAANIVGSFGTVPSDGSHLNNGIFLQSVEKSGGSYNATVLHAVAGDSNGVDGFSSSDLIVVFTASQYEDGVPNNSNWLTGDWNHDTEFDTSDLVLAFQIGAYETGPILATPDHLVGAAIAVDTLDHRIETAEQDRGRQKRARRVLSDERRQRIAELNKHAVELLFE